jgi:hypothetical protein
MKLLNLGKGRLFYEFIVLDLELTDKASVA